VSLILAYLLGVVITALLFALLIRFGTTREGRKTMSYGTITWLCILWPAGLLVLLVGFIFALCLET
jgi:hypothetical protein